MPPNPLQPDDELRRVRAVATDARIVRQRAVTPDVVENQRSVPRLSIAEINAMDLEDLRRTYSATRIDTRGPATRFLDLIDLPRNFIAGRILANPTRERKEREGEIGTFAEGKVNVSDILADLGVENRIVRGIGGFVGDLAIDPLTYIGPVGWGAKAVGTGGRAVTMTRGFTKAVREAGKAAAAGRSAGHAGLEAYLRAAGADAATLAAKGTRGKAARAAVEDALFGGRSAVGKVLESVGEDVQGVRSRFADDVWGSVSEAANPLDNDRIRAAKSIYQEFGRHSASGIRIGKDANTAIAHIPFTEVGLYVPSITPRAKVASAAALAARSMGGTDPASPVTDAAREGIDTLNGLLAEANAAREESETLAHQIADFRSTDPASLTATADVQEAARARLSQIAESSRQLRARVQEAATASQDRLRGLSAAATADPDAILYVGNHVIPAADAHARLAVARAEQAAAAIAQESELHRLMTGEIEARVAARTRQSESAGLFADEASIADEEYRAYRNSLQSEADRDILALTPEAMEARSALADALHTTAAAAMDYAQAARAPLDTLMRGPDRAVRDLAAVMLGVTPDTIGYSALGSIKNAARSALIDRNVGVAAAEQAIDTAQGIETRLHRIFGTRSGEAFEWSKRLARASTPAASPVFRQTVANIVRDTDKAIAGLPVTRDQALSFVTAMMQSGEDTLVPGGVLATMLDDAVKRGFFDPKTFPDLWNRLKSVATTYGKALDDAFMAEQSVGIAPESRIGSYFPNVPTLEAATRIGKQYENIEKLGPEARDAARLARERFQHARSTLEYTLPDGRTFIDAERPHALIAKDPAALSQLAPDDRRRILELAKTIDDYDALPRPQKPTPKVLSVHDINRMHREGRFHLLTGGPLQGSFMEENAALAIANRLMQHDRAVLGVKYREWLAPFFRAVDEEQISRVILDPASKGADFTLKNGAKARFYQGHDGLYRMRIGDVTYRKPRLEGSADWNPINSLYAKDQITGWLPERLADDLENHVNLANSPEKASELVAGIESMTRAWKMATLLHPSWIINDLIGTTALAFNAGIGPAQLSKHFLTAFRIAKANNAGSLSRIPEITIGGRVFHPSEIAAAEHVFGSGSPREAMLHATKDGQYLAPPVARLFSAQTARDPAGNIRAIGREMNENAKKLAAASAAASHLGKIPGYTKFQHLKGLTIDEGLKRRLWEPWIALNSLANDTVRGAAYLSLLEDGWEPVAAARHIGEKLLDVGALTAKEQEFRRWLPFYSWMRASAVFGVRQMLENPKFFSAAPHAKHAIEELVNGENTVPEHLRPAWMRDQMALQFGSTDDAHALLIGQMLPSEAAQHFLTGAASPIIGMEAFSDSAKYLANSLNPAVRTALEVANGREWFTGRSIASPELGGDLTPLEHVAGQIRPLRELGVGNVRQGPLLDAAAKSPALAASRALIGGRVQPFDQARIASGLQRDYDDKIALLRKRINLAQREGNTAQSLRYRARLMRLFAEMQQNGLDIPRWADKQLAEITQP